MRAVADLEIVQPLPYFPIVRPLPRWARSPSHTVDGNQIHHAPMPYVPGVLKRFDGRFLERAVMSVVGPMHRARPFDLIEAHFGFPDGVGALRAAARLGVPAFVTVRGLETDYLRDPAIGPQLAEALRRAAGCVSVSHSLKRLVTEHGVPPDSVRVIPNSVDRNLFRPAEKSAARASLDLPADEPLVLTVGTLINLKRHHVVVQALARVRQEHPGARLAIIGTEREERDYPTRLRKLAADLGLQQAVRIVGAVAPPDVARWLAAADTFCLVSAREGCCNAVLEALACGRPVVTTPAGDNPDFVKDGQNGYVVPIDDVEATATALIAAIGARHWDADRISKGLSVGDWAGVAAQVVDFFNERLAIHGQRTGSVNRASP